MGCEKFHKTRFNYISRHRERERERDKERQRKRKRGIVYINMLPIYTDLNWIRIPQFYQKPSYGILNGL